MTTNPGFTRTSERDSIYFKNIPQEMLKKIWGVKKTPKEIQDIHFSSDAVHTTTNDEVEKFAEKAEKDFHKQRRETWMKGYIKNYISRHPKDMDLYEI